MGPTSKQTGDSVSVSWTRVRRGRALWEGTARPGCSACRRRDPGTAEFQNEGHSHVEFSRHCYISLLITTSFICDPPLPPKLLGFSPSARGSRVGRPSLSGVPFLLELHSADLGPPELLPATLFLSSLFVLLPGSFVLFLTQRVRNRNFLPPQRSRFVSRPPTRSQA